MAERSRTPRVRIMNNHVMKPYKPIVRPVADIVGKEVEIVSVSGATSRAQPSWEGCYGTVVETGLSDVVLVRVSGRGSAWCRKYLTRS